MPDYCRVELQNLKVFVDLKKNTSELINITYVKLPSIFKIISKIITEGGIV